MYTTRPLSVYQRAPEAMSMAPEGPNSGYLVLQDEESTPTWMFGLLKARSIKEFPLPQNKLIHIEYGTGENHSHQEVYLIPALNQPLSSNRYYIIKAEGWTHKGEAYASSKDEDASNLVLFRVVHDVKPRPFDPSDIYQQFEFSIKRGWFRVKSLATDGNPPFFMRKRSLSISGHTARNFTLGEANGLNSTLCARLPDFSFPLALESSDSVLVVGKWYCPFMFIKEWTEKDQMKKSMFYQMTLEQRWERVFVTQNSYGETSNKTLGVNVDVVIPTDTVRIGGHEAVEVEKNDGGGVVWFSSIDVNTGGEQVVGLSRLIVDRMMWEQERGGWIKGQNKQIRVTKQEKCEQGFWDSYGCYVLVESFVLRRNDGSLVLTWDFRHSHQLRSKWE